MAIASVGTIGTAAHSTSATSYTLTPTNTLDAGNTGLLVMVTDNTATTDGDNNEHTSVTDSVGNTYKKLGEHCNSNAAAAAGVTVSVWMVRATTALTSANTVTMTIATARVDKCASLWEFSSPFAWARAGLTQNDTDGANGFGSLTTATVPSRNYLFFRGLGKEANTTTAITVTAGHTAITGTRSRNNAAAVIVRGEFIITTATSDTSDPTLAVVGDTASVFVTLEEELFGWRDPERPALLPPTHKTVRYGNDAGSRNP